MRTSTYISMNPFNKESFKKYDVISNKEVAKIIIKADEMWKKWSLVAVKERVSLLLNLAIRLEENALYMAETITKEMGKPILQSLAEVKKCAKLCRFYAEHSENYLKNKVYSNEGRKIKLAYESLGTVLGIMPWNFPFWQVFRFAVPAIISGNTVLLKHAENVPGSALLLEEIFLKAGFEPGIYQNLFVDHEQIKMIIQDYRIKGVALTGSEKAGGIVAAIAGANIKPVVLELGGSDPFIVCEDADIDLCVNAAVSARMQNTGQSCIAAKRFIINKKISDLFIKSFVEKILQLKIGNPMDKEVNIGPLAREDLLLQLENQLNTSVKMGAKILCGGKRSNLKGNFIEPTVVTEVRSEMPLYKEEVFGPLATIFVVNNDEEAVQIANDTRFGLAASVWSADIDKALNIGRQLECGSLFVNAIVKSDPAFPFGGVKYSGYGRELGEEGIKSFVNVKTYNY